MKRIILIITISFVTIICNCQEKSFLPFNFIFGNDSLQGFDELSAKQNALQAGCFGNEYKVFMYYAKRKFINTKYHLDTNEKHIPKDNFGPAASACLNEDFESSPTGTINASNQVLGWTISAGTNSITGGSCQMTNSGGCCPMQPISVEVVSNGFIDPSIGPKYPIHSVFGSNLNSGDTVSLNASLGNMFGNNFIRFNDYNPNFSVHKLSKKILVTPANSLFKFAYISVFYPAHACCDAPAFQINIKNLTTGTASLCPSFSFAPGPTCIYSSPITYYDCGTTSTSTLNPGSRVYNPWEIRSIDLRPFTNDSIQIDFVISDCVYGAHQGWAYLDAQCGPMEILTNVPPGPLQICLASGTATLSAVPGFTPYQWSGPGNFSSNSQSITISSPGDYTLTIGDSCLKTTYVVPVTALPVLTVTPFYYLCSGTATLNAAGAVNYTWTPGNLNGNSITPSPTVTTNYTVVGANGTCTNSAVSTVSVGSAPSLTLSSSKQVGCIGACFTLSNSPSGFNPITYNWGDNSSTTPMMATHCYSTAGIFTVTAQATYSSGCTVVSSGIYTITIIPNPTAGINIVGGALQPTNTPITFNNTSTGANSYTWDFGDSTSVLYSISLSDVIHSYTSSGTHCVKLIATDTLYGCKDSLSKCLETFCTSDISFPNVFTPNGDDVNEVFTIPNTCLKKLNCIIYDRWGLKIYDWDKVHGAWDGRTIAGVAVSEGTYFFILTYVTADDKEIRKTGTVSLFR